jgi:hypothetical protein
LHKLLSADLEPLDRDCTLIFDEMAIQPHLDLNLKNGCIDGLEDFGSGKSKTTADHALVLMLRGVTKKWKLTFLQSLLQNLCSCNN